MNKMKKLLSVVLAVVLAFSALSVLGSAAKTNYQTVANLKALDAYSPYGQVTRLATEERMSIVMDSLDTLLATANIYPGTLFSALGLSLTVDLRSIDGLCATVDNAKSLLSNGLVSLVKGMLGILGDINLGNWDSGMKRASVDQLHIISELLTVLNDNSGVIYNVVSTGSLDLGLIGGALGDISSITGLIGDIPGLIKGLVFPLIERWDDSLELIKEYDTASKGNGNVESIVNKRVKKLFTDNMSNTTVKYDADGNMTSEHLDMPIYTTVPGTPSNDSPRCYYYQNGNTLKIYHIVDAAEAKASEGTDKVLTAYTYVEQEETYYLEQEVEGSATYVWKSTDELGNVTTLKYYNDNSPLLPGFDGSKFDLAEMSAGELLYTFMPVVFKELAPVVLNGSVKKALASFVGVEFTYVGHAGPEGDDAVLALGDDAIFADEQGDYVFEWSDYAIVDGVHYYRYLDDLYVGDTSNVNNYFDIINWEFKVTDDFLNDFIPESAADASDRLLLNISDFLAEVGNLVLLPSAETDDTNSDYTATWTRPTFAPGNANFVSNVKALAQAVVGLAPQHIFGDDYATNPRCYVDLMLSSDNDTVLVGIAATLVDLIMPSMTLPSKDEIISSGAKVGAILAAVVREFAAYLTPEYNYDALIYTDFGTTTADPVKSFVTGKDSEYWFDVILTMGINVGFEYLRAFADMGEGTAEWDAFVEYSGYAPEGKTYPANMTTAELNAHWEGMLDYIIDWALDKDYEWTWKMENLVNTADLTIDLASAQDPFVKLQQILGSILPVDEILTVEPAEGETKFEHWLRQDLILGIVDLEWDHLINTIQFNGTNKYFRTANVLDQLAKLVKGIVNSLFAKVGGGSYALLPAAMTDFDSLANQANLATMIQGLLGALNTAYSRGLLDTVLPFLNMFIGWKMDPQVVADPSIWVTNRDDKAFAYQTSTTISGTSINFLNNSSGMLEIHRNSTVEDHEYAIQITGVTSDATTNTLSFNYGDGYVSPYETLAISVGGTYRGEEAATITIAYEYLGKDGSAIGGTQYTSVTIFFSNQSEDSDVVEAKKEMDSGLTWSTHRGQYNKYIFTEDIYTTINGTTGEVKYKNSVVGNTPFKQYESPDLSVEGPTNNNGTPDNSCDDYTEWYPVGEPAYDEHFTDYFTYKTRDESGWPGEIAGYVGMESGGSGSFFKNQAQYGKDYEFPYGVYAPDKVSVTYDGEAVFEFVFIHYDNYGIDELYTANMNNGYNANQGVDTATYNEYNAAWKDVVKLATYPMMTKINGHTGSDYVDVIMPQIKPAMERFEAAKEAYEIALADAQSSGAADSALPSYVEALKEEIDNDFAFGKEINFQDYEYYEYFNYNDVKVAAENVYRSYLAPEIMDTYYIMGSGIREAELNEVVAAEGNPFIAAGILASRMMNDQEAIDASIAAKDEWKQPTHTKLYVEDFTSRLGFYKQFLAMDVTREDADHMYFLEKEIAHIEAQQLDASEYEAVTWGRFADALEVAKSVAAGEDEFSGFNSRIYDAKYNLMVTYKELMKQADSLIAAGGTAVLNANIEKANAIFASLEAGDGAWTLSADYEGEEDDAYAALISALGYKYVGEDGYTYDLYADSALEYSENDRPNRSGNQAKVDKANEALEAAIANFVAAEEPAGDPELILTEYGEEMGALIDFDICTSYYDGAVYGVDTINGEALEDYYTTEFGYITVVENENGVFSTGATIELYSDDDELIATYVFIYFGDVNGDEVIDISDAGDIESHDGWDVMFDDDSPYLYAADVNADGVVDISDAGDVESHDGWDVMLPEQYEIAAGIADAY